MKKIKLNLEDLRVESFDTSASGKEQDGTVFGQTQIETDCNFSWCLDCTGGANTNCCPDASAESWASCGTTCQADGTCGNGDTCAGAFSMAETICVTGCEQCPCP